MYEEELKYNIEIERGIAGYNCLVSYGTVGVGYKNSFCSINEVLIFAENRIERHKKQREIEKKLKKEMEERLEKELSKAGF